MTVLAVVVLFPIYITVVNSLLRPDQIAARPPSLFPTDPQWGAYEEAWTDGHMGRYLVNSAVVTTLIMVGQVLFASSPPNVPSPVNPYPRVSATSTGVHSMRSASRA